MQPRRAARPRTAGSQRELVLHSFMTTYSRTPGYACASAVSHAANFGRVRRIGEGRGVARIDVERDADARRLRRCERGREELGLAAVETVRRRLVPAQRDGVRGHPDAEQSRPERTGTLFVLAGVVVDAPCDVVGRRGGRPHAERGHAGRQCRREPSQCRPFSSRSAADVQDGRPSRVVRRPRRATS